MPTYEYKCSKCKKVFDYFQSITSKPLTKCIHCRGKVERLIGAGAGLIFKGSGFYITDYKKKPEASHKAPAKKPDTGPQKSKESKAKKD